MSSRAGLDLRDLIEAAHSYKSVEKFSKRAKIMEYIVQNIDQYASNPRRSRPVDSIFSKIKFFGESLFFGSGIYLGNYIVTTYFFVKLAYLVNSIVQFFIMNEFLGKQFHELGMDILRYLTNTYNHESSESVYFPKVVMCDFSIREFGHPNFSHRYSIQCVLPINLYNQQFFTFLWFWFLILFIANCWALVQWANRMLPKSRRRYINRRLNMLQYFKDLNQATSVLMKPRGIFGRRKSVSIEAKKQKRRFIDDYLKFDGVFVLRMVSILTSEVIGTELLHELWKKRAVYKDLYFYDNHNKNQNDFYLSYNETNDDNENGSAKNFDSINGDMNNKVPFHRSSKTSQIREKNMQLENIADLKKASIITADKDRVTYLKNNRYTVNRNPQNPPTSKPNLKYTKSEGSLLNKDKENSGQLTLRQNSLLNTNANDTNDQSSSKVSKAKKVVFASSLDNGFSDIENVFSDLNLDK